MSLDLGATPETHVGEICTALDFHRMSRAATRPGAVERVLKFTLPSRDDPTLLGPLFQNTRRFPLHQEFLAAAFPERFAVLGVSEYNDLVARRGTREYFAGAISWRRSGGSRVYGFDVFVDLSDPREQLDVDEVRLVYQRL